MKKEPTVIKDKQKIEYGDDLTKQTFTINHEGKEMEANFTNLDPKVDTMELGETIPCNCCRRYRDACF